jgi:hypothetical protein
MQECVTLVQLIDYRPTAIALGMMMEYEDNLERINSLK